MFTPFLQRLFRRGQPDYEHGFVQDVQVVRRTPRNRRVEWLFLVCWILIGVKSAVVIWAVRHYHIPFSAFWIVGPTVAFAALVSLVYWRRN